MNINPAPVRPNVVSICVISDFNCPWCYVGHREIGTALARARKEFPAAEFRLHYRPYIVDPTLPKASEEPMCRVSCYKAKFGEKKYQEVAERLTIRGKEVGIDFQVSGKIRQSTNAHRLALKAYLLGGEEAQTKMVEALFAAYYEKSADVGCYDFLSKAAESTGLMTHDAARQFLESDSLKEEVFLMVRDSMLRGVSQLPCTVINNTWAVVGAERADTFYDALSKAYQLNRRDLASSTETQSLSEMNVVQTAAACKAAADAPALVGVN